jgi:hypothetical protein
MLLCGLAPAANNSAARLKAFAQLPDWSGIWELAESPSTFQPLPRPPKGVEIPPGDVRDHPPYNPEWEAQYEERLKHLPDQVDSNLRYCAAGFPRLMGSPFLMEAFVEPQETLMSFTQREVRHIYTDGRGHPAPDDLWPTLWGDSIGHWEGDTLVVDTISIKGGLFLDPSAATLSDKVHVTERIRMTAPDRLVDEMIIEDPAALTQPWKVTKPWRRVTDTNRMIDEVCQENNRNPIENGKIKTYVK